MGVKHRVLVLGGGLVGRTIAWDLARGGTFDVTVADVRAEVLEAVARDYGVATLHSDLSRPEAVRAAVQGFDLVLGALSSALGWATLRAVIEAGKPYVDISFMAEDPLELDALAKERGVVALVDCGVAPGLSSVMAGYAVTQLEPCERLEVYVGGLPAVRSWPWEYKAPFAPSDVIEEYVRPARYVAHGELVVREALSEPEPFEMVGVGTLEAFNTDGLRTLARTLDVPHMKEKTLRYPGHIELMRVLRQLGLFSREPIEVDGVWVSPLALTSKLLFPQWTYGEGEEDLTVLRVVAEGKLGGAPRRLVWELCDRRDPVTGMRSMSRTTAFPATILAGLVASGRYAEPGVHAPEDVGRVPGMLEHMLSELAARGVTVTSRVE
jgi:lysine 6-dehydrogenase